MYKALSHPEKMYFFFLHTYKCKQVSSVHPEVHQAKLQSTNTFQEINSTPTSFCFRFTYSYKVHDMPL